jgi:hypothetical protein
MAKRLEIARPMVRRGAGVDADQTRRSSERTPKHTDALSDDERSPCHRINAVDLKNRFGNAETGCRDFHD